MSPRPSTREIMMQDSPPCLDHGERLTQLEMRQDTMETTLEKHDTRLSAGDSGFAELRKDFALLNQAVNTLAGNVLQFTNAAWWVVKTIVGSVLVLGVAGIVFLVEHADKIK